MTGNISTNYNAEHRGDGLEGFEEVATDSYAAQVTEVAFADGEFTAEGVSSAARAAWFSDRITLPEIALNARAGDKVVVSATLMRRTGVDQQG